jgi:adenylylsulfate kinase
MTTILFTGIPASGKTTLASSVAAGLDDLYYKVVVLDGDDLRSGLCSDLGFSRADRHEQARRCTELAILLGRQETTVLLAYVAPYEADRIAMAKRHYDAEIPFYVVHMNVPANICHKRDPKGLYTRFGIAAVEGDYENPVAADLVMGVSSSPDDVFRMLKIGSMV